MKCYKISIVVIYSKPWGCLETCSHWKYLFSHCCQEK